MPDKSKLLFTGSDWNSETIARIADACSVISNEELGLNIYENAFEIITSEQMLDAYASIGMPIGYNHWSYGKTFVREEQNYRSGKSGLAYELVINSRPCINYLMEENSATIQALVIAHAGWGHNHFFKNNYMFTEWTDAESIIDYLLFAKNYIRECEEKYGIAEVEEIIDSAHALQAQGIDKYKKPTKLSLVEETKRQKEREEYIQSQVNILWDSFDKTTSNDKPARKKLPEEPEENVLKFIEKNSPTLRSWQREIIRIVRMISQYFYPQRQTKVMNEGFACWTHCYMMNRLHEKGLITEGAMLEFLSTHSNVVMQPSFDSPYYSGINPYALGLNMFRDIERICKNPTEEDREWFPDIAGTDYIETIKHAVVNYRDESFIRQFLSPHLIREMRLFQIGDEDADFYVVKGIHNRDGYKKIRKALANSYEIGNQDPDIQVVDANMNSDRALELVHYTTNDQLLVEEDALECIKHMKRLWGFDVIISSIDSKTGELIDEYTTIT